MLQNSSNLVQFPEPSRTRRHESAFLGEDFLTDTAFNAGVSVLKKKYPALTGDPTKTTTGRLDEVKKWLAQQGVPGDQHKEYLNYLKTKLFDVLSPADIDISYYDYLKALKPSVNAM